MRWERANGRTNGRTDGRSTGPCMQRLYSLRLFCYSNLWLVFIYIGMTFLLLLYSYILIGCHYLLLMYEINRNILVHLEWCVNVGLSLFFYLQWILCDANSLMPKSNIQRFAWFWWKCQKKKVVSTHSPD